MMKLRCQMAFAGLVCVAGFWNVGEAAGQSLGTPSTNPGTTSGMPITGIPIMPLPLTTPMFASPLPNSASPGTDAGGNPVQGNIFANPYAAPLIYGSMMQGPFGSSLSSSATASTSTSMSSSTAASASASAANSRANMGLGVGQLGLLMLATQNPNGIGSGQLSGARSSRNSIGRPDRRQGDQPGPNLVAACRTRGSLLQSNHVPSADSSEFLQPANPVLPINRSSEGKLPGFDLSEGAIVPILSPVKVDPTRDGSGPPSEGCHDGEQAGFRGELDCPRSSPGVGFGPSPRAPVRPKSECREDVWDESQ